MSTTPAITRERSGLPGRAVILTFAAVCVIVLGWVVVRFGIQGQNDQLTVMGQLIAVTNDFAVEVLRQRDAFIPTTAPADPARPLVLPGEDAARLARKRWVEREKAERMQRDGKLWEGPDPSMVDHFGTPIRVESEPLQGGKILRVTARSAGPDRAYDTADDLISSKDVDVTLGSVAPVRPRR